MQIPNRQVQKGFTIIETLVSLAIFTISILGLIVITSSGVANTNYAKNKLIASYLAQEGVEIVHNLRDSAALSGASWQDTFGSSSLTGLSNCYATAQGSGCDIDAYTFALTSCSTATRAGCGPLRYDSFTGEYRSFASDASIPESSFTRIVTLRDVSPNEVQVTSTVSWTQGTAAKSVTVNETLNDWATIAPVAPPAQ
jgi:prepilin-type N-terminal cleavage/methylation domain-containing protein